MGSQLSLAGLRLVAPPATYLRVSRHRFDAPPPPPPLDDADAVADDAGRFDSPDGGYRTVYCAARAEGAIGEKLAEFRLRADLAARIEAYFDSPPDEE